MFVLSVTDSSLYVRGDKESDMVRGLAREIEEESEKNKEKF